MTRAGATIHPLVLGGEGVVGERRNAGATAVVPALGILVLTVAAGCHQAAVEWSGPPASLQPSGRLGAAHGFPAMRTPEGDDLADGEFRQVTDGERIEIEARYDFGGGRAVEERVVLRQAPELAQEWWSWREVENGRTIRRFEIDFLAGSARAEKREGGELHQWSESVELPRGRAFAGLGFPPALGDLRQRLLAGETIELETVGFTPEPRQSTVEVSFHRLDHVPMSGRTLLGDHFVVHPKVPLLARPFVEAPDTHLWLTHSSPAGFLRWEGPLAEPSDPIVRVDLLPGESSGEAVPAESSDRPGDDEE